MIIRGLILSLPPLVLMLGLAAWGWIITPEGAEIPVHFAADGSVNRYGSKLEAFGVVPALSLALVGLFAVVPLIDPRGGNVRRSRPLVLVSWAGTMWVMAVAQGAITLSVTGLVSETDWMPRLIGIAVGVLFAVIGNVLGKARPNWFFGIRTPWTLSSDRAWDAAHRWAGWLFVFAGLISAGGMFILPVRAAFPVLIVVTLLAAFLPMVVSYFVWRSDPDRETYHAPLSDDDDSV